MLTPRACVRARYVMLWYGMSTCQIEYLWRELILRGGEHELKNQIKIFGRVWTFGRSGLFWTFGLFWTLGLFWIFLDVWIVLDGRLRNLQTFFPKGKLRKSQTRFEIFF